MKFDNSPIIIVLEGFKMSFIASFNMIIAMPLVGPSKYPPSITGSSDKSNFTKLGASGTEKSRNISTAAMLENSAISTNFFVLFSLFICLLYMYLSKM